MRDRRREEIERGKKRKRWKKKGKWNTRIFEITYIPSDESIRPREDSLAVEVWTPPGFLLDGNALDRSEMTCLTYIFGYKLDSI